MSWPISSPTDISWYEEILRMNDLVITEEASLSFVLQTTDILKNIF